MKAPIKKILSIVESCTNDLESYSRYLGRKDNDKDSILSLSYLPKELVNNENNKTLSKLKKYLQANIEGETGIAEVESILEFYGNDAPLKFNKKDAEEFVNLIGLTGYGIAPDPRYHNSKPDIDGEIVIYKVSDFNEFTPSHHFKEICTIVRLGAMVAKIDDHVDSREEDLLKSIIDNEKKLSEKEVKSLKAYLIWRLKTPPNMSGLKSIIEKLGETDKIFISNILIDVALADSKIEPSEIKQLEKLYTALGLDKSLVTSDIHKRKTINKESISSSKDKAQMENTFKLDYDLLKKHEAETKDVQSILETIFVEDSNLVNEANNSDVKEELNIANSLDDEYVELYNKLITKEEWTQSEITSLCKSFGLMVDGAIEVINDWAFDLVDAPLIEEGSTYYIDLDINKEINEILLQEV